MGKVTRRIADRVENVVLGKNPRSNPDKELKKLARDEKKK